MTDIIKRKVDELSLIERLQLIRSNKDRPCLLLDISGSMDGEKIRKLREIVAGMPLIGIDVYAFETVCQLIDKDHIPNPRGGTNLSLAFQHIKQAGKDKCVLITDGMPDNKDAALRDSTGLSLEIIYVGPDPRPKFLDDLASACGGHSFSMSLADIKEVQGKVTLLLESGKGSNGAVAPKGPICL